MKWCDEGIYLLASQPVDKCQSQDGAEAALQEIEKFLETGAENKIQELSRIYQDYEPILTRDLLVRRQLFSWSTRGCSDGSQRHGRSVGAEQRVPFRPGVARRPPTPPPGPCLRGGPLLGSQAPHAPHGVPACGEGLCSAPRPPTPPPGPCLRGGPLLGAGAGHSADSALKPDSSLRPAVRSAPPAAHRASGPGPLPPWCPPSVEGRAGPRVSRQLSGGVLLMSPSPPSRQEHVQKVFRKQESVEEMFHRRQASLKKLAAKQTRPVQPVAPRPEAPTKSPCPSPGTSSRPSPWGRPSLRPARCVRKASSALGLLTPFLASVLLPLLWLDGDHLTVGAFPGLVPPACPWRRSRDGLALARRGPPPRSLLVPPGQRFWKAQPDPRPFLRPLLSPPVCKHAAPAASTAPAAFYSCGRCRPSVLRAPEPSARGPFGGLQAPSSPPSPGSRAAPGSGGQWALHAPRAPSPTPFPCSVSYCAFLTLLGAARCFSSKS
ncbi:hypothetical protein J1605_009364 [Eschrichtius robustus]|uniref:Guanine nucleotide exchange factor DBS-like spectrin-like domain-containing protein n=1 Tax=Eschrichtius robustus TaxID=9764 RepID=A0AB34GS40_ESCRO|nr:hypothetical protein J1605_009364 [Eschrichtius robustus]